MAVKESQRVITEKGKSIFVDNDYALNETLTDGTQKSKLVADHTAEGSLGAEIKKKLSLGQFIALK